MNGIFFKVVDNRLCIYRNLFILYFIIHTLFYYYSILYTYRQEWTCCSYIVYLVTRYKLLCDIFNVLHETYLCLITQKIITLLFIYLYEKFMIKMYCIVKI